MSVLPCDQMTLTVSDSRSLQGLNQVPFSEDLG